MTKPFGMDELLARLRAAVAPRTAPAPENADRRHRRLHRSTSPRRRSPAPAASEIHLTPIEWQTARGPRAQPGPAGHPAAAAAGRVGPAVRRARPTTCACTWRHLRRKLEPDPSRPRYFITEPGMGYRFLSHREDSEAIDDDA